MEDPFRRLTPRAGDLADDGHAQAISSDGVFELNVIPGHVSGPF